MLFCVAYVKFYVTRCTFALVIAKCLGVSLFLDEVDIQMMAATSLCRIMWLLMIDVKTMPNAPGLMRRTHSAGIKSTKNYARCRGGRHPFVTIYRLIVVVCHRLPLPSFSAYQYLIVSKNQQNEFRFLYHGNASWDKVVAFRKRFMWSANVFYN